MATVFITRMPLVVVARLLDFYLRFGSHRKSFEFLSWLICAAVIICINMIRIRISATQSQRARTHTFMATNSIRVIRNGLCLYSVCAFQRLPIQIAANCTQ